MHSDPDFPAIRALTESAIAAMKQAEAEEARAARANRGRRIRRGAVVALAVLGIGTPAAIAVKSALSPNAVPTTIPLVDPVTGHIEEVDATGIVVAEGFRGTEAWTIYARRCEAHGRVSIADAAAIGFQRRAQPGGVSTCTDDPPDPDRPGLSRPNGATSFRTRGLTVIYGFVPSAAASVDVTTTSNDNPSETRRFTLDPEPIPDALVEEGDLPSGYSLYHAQVDEDLGITSANVKDAAGTTILICTPGACEAPTAEVPVAPARRALVLPRGAGPTTPGARPGARPAGCASIGLHLIGLSELRAGRYALSHGCAFRVVRREGKNLQHFTDFRSSRINAATRNGKVTAVESIG